MKIRAKSTKQLSYQGNLISDTVADISDGGGDQIFISNLPPALSPPEEPPLPGLRPVRRQIRCSGCNQKGHSFNKCPKAYFSEVYVVWLFKWCLKIEIIDEVPARLGCPLAWKSRLH